MPRITFSADAAVFSGNPHEKNQVNAPEVFKQLHGVHSGDQFCSEFLDAELVRTLGLKGGRLRFEFEESDNRFRISTTYSIDRKPSKQEMSQLYRETEAQWSDGIGSGEFESFRGEVMSATLGMALINEDPNVDHLSDYFVEAWPILEDRNMVAKWSYKGGHNDYLVRDLREGVRQGDSNAETMLASILMEGDGVAQDQKTAVALLARGVKRGEEAATTKFATALLEGNGVEAAPHIAIRLLEKCVAEGSPLAIAQLGDVYKNGRGVPADPEKAIPLLQQAADIGFLPALAELGDCYELGIGVEPDADKARQMYNACMEQGFDAVAPALARMDEPAKGSAASKFKKQKEKKQKKKGGGIFGFLKRKKKD